ncbi:MAG: FAD-binding protein [Lachnospiraceae bacterium]|nr:FAD-binding protein [Lachnospiraceae bacterium]
MKQETNKKKIIRRDILSLSGAAVAAAGVTAFTGNHAGASESTEETSSTLKVDVSDQVELDIPAGESPEATEYETDVLVVGCGMAGLHAAAGAKDAGASVLVVEKGTPGYGGLTPFAGGTTYFNTETGDIDTTLKFMSQSNEYILNQNWLRVWCEESPAYYERISEWGLVDAYTEPADTDYWVDGYFDGSDGHDDQRGYFQSVEVSQNERHHKFVDVLDEKGIDHIEHVMVCDVIESEGRVVGAVALHVPSGELITIKAKAVIMCCGSGTVKPAGYPLGGAAFDTTYICYKHGLPVAGGEFEDYHLAYGGKPGLVLTTSGWDYSEPFRVTPSGKAADTAEEDMWSGSYLQWLNYYTCINGLTTPDPTYMSSSKHTLTTGWTAPGSAPGFPLHMTGGVFNGWDDVDGATALPGLYAAGDGSLASYIGGACYYGISGLTTSSCGVQGYRAGTAAAEYLADLDFVDLPEDEVASLEEEILRHLDVERGFRQVWVAEQLQNAIATQPTIFRKSEAILNAALTQVEFIRDNYLPKLKANSTHDLRLCREVIQKTTAMEIKLRAGLARKESRGFHYRTDYPYRDDQYLGVFACTKTDDGMELNLVEIPDEWKGDMTADYVDRYPSYRFDGEAEALGLSEEE